MSFAMHTFTNALLMGVLGFVVGSLDGATTIDIMLVLGAGLGLIINTFFLAYD